MYPAAEASKRSKDKGFAASRAAGDLTALYPQQGSSSGIAPQAPGLGHLASVLWTLLFLVYLHGHRGIYL